MNYCIDHVVRILEPLWLKRETGIVYGRPSSDYPRAVISVVGVGPEDFNVGIWVLGSQLVDCRLGMVHKTKREGCALARRGDGLVALLARCACEDNEFWHLSRMSIVVFGDISPLGQGIVGGYIYMLGRTFKGFIVNCSVKVLLTAMYVGIPFSNCKSWLWICSVFMQHVAIRQITEPTCIVPYLASSLPLVFTMLGARNL